MFQLRALNIPFIAGYPPAGYDPRLAAQHIADIITLRPEIRLGYVGFGPKCFEILDIRPPAEFPETLGPHDASADVPNDDQEDWPDGGDGSDDYSHDWEEEDQDENTPTTTTSDDDDESEDFDDDDDLPQSPDRFHAPLDDFQVKLREILFYDEKIAIFAARFGRL